MPTYYATGVSATLSTCDLQATLSSNLTNFRQGGERKVGAARIQEAFSAADRLSERPLGSDGIVQFIGLHGDMPFYMAESGKSINQPTASLDSRRAKQDGSKEAEVEPEYQLPDLSDDSPLTSLGATPTTPVQQGFSESLFKQPPPVQLTMEALASLANEQTLQSQVQAARSRPTSPNAQALVLDVQFTDKSFLPEEKNSRDGKRLVGKDLKIEVFVNGRLADVGIINNAEKRRTAIQVSGDTARFAGTRIHRQVEKPWIYSRDAFDPDELPDADDAERRWNSIGSCYLIEAEMRGRNRFHDLPPSAEFLKALAGQEFPQQVAARQRLAILDVVITAGRGRKYGPETTYLMKPTRMDDRTYVRQELFQQSEHIGPTILSLKRGAIETNFTPANMVTTPHGLSTALNVVSPAPKKTVEITDNIGSNIEQDKITNASYENSRGNRGKSERILRQRIGDLMNMNSTNPDRNLAELEHEYVSTTLPEKSSKIAHLLDDEALLVFSAIAGLNTAVDSTKLSRETSQLPGSADREAVLTQARIDMALNEGSDSNGALLRRIASISPQRTPERTTKASALARSPMCSPVKSPTRKSAPSATHNRKKVNFDVPLVLTSKTKASTKMDTSPLAAGLITTPQKKKAAERSVSEALKAFQIPDGCKGSCVSYDEDEHVSRLIGKARGGEFKEETVLVGMRFVVD